MKHSFLVVWTVRIAVVLVAGAATLGVIVADTYFWPALLAILVLPFLYCFKGFGRIARYPLPGTQVTSGMILWVFVAVAAMQLVGRFPWTLAGVVGALVAALLINYVRYSIRSARCFEQNGYRIVLRGDGRSVYEERRDGVTESLPIPQELMEPGLNALVIPTLESWNEAVPEWAFGRRDEICRRIVSWQKWPEIIYPPDWTSIGS